MNYFSRYHIRYFNYRLKTVSTKLCFKYHIQINLNSQFIIIINISLKICARLVQFKHFKRVSLTPKWFLIQMFENPDMTAQNLVQLLSYKPSFNSQVMLLLTRHKGKGGLVAKWMGGGVLPDQRGETSRIKTPKSCAHPSTPRANPQTGSMAKISHTNACALYM